MAIFTVINYTFFVINGLLVAACYFFNHYVHYFIILLAYHIGIMCV